MTVEAKDNISCRVLEGIIFDEAALPAFFFDEFGVGDRLQESFRSFRVLTNGVVVNDNELRVRRQIVVHPQRLNGEEYAVVVIIRGHGDC